MRGVTQQDTFALVAGINGFIDRAESSVQAVQQSYQAQKKQLQDAHAAQRAELEAAFGERKSNIAHRAMNTLLEAKRIFEDVHMMDEQLSAVDKYYASTRKKHGETLSGVTSDRYAGAIDYAETLAMLKADHAALARRYADEMLPAVINGVHYLISSKRRRDYAELIVLLNTVDAFCIELEQVVSEVALEGRDAADEELMARLDTLLAGQGKALETLETGYTAALEKVADAIIQGLDALLPDDEVERLSTLAAAYAAGLLKVNGGDGVADGLLDLLYVDYPVDVFVQSRTIASILKAKCGPLMAGESVRFPVALPAGDSQAWMAETDGSGAEAALALSHSVMFGLLTTLPVGRLSYCIVDPENRGNSVAPFFEARKKLPELFAGQILADRGAIADELRRIVGRLDEIQQYSLGGRYADVFACAADSGQPCPQVQLLMIYDFPRGFDEQSLADLRNIVRNGGRCGVYTFITHQPQPGGPGNDGLVRAVQSVRELCVLFGQAQGGFTLRGLPVPYYPMPDKAAFDRFFSLYMLRYEGIRNRGIAFPPLVKKLAEARDDAGLEAHIALLCQMMETAERHRGHVPAPGAGFPDHLTVGTIRYPADVFAESPGAERICRVFGAGGQLDEDAPGTVELPLAFDLGGPVNLFLGGGMARQQALAFSHHFIWALLSALPPAMANICVFDNGQRGNSILPFLDLVKALPAVFDGRVYTEPEAMVQRLRELNGRIDEMIQTRLGSRYGSLLEYDQGAARRAEALTLLVLYDFPAGMDSRGLDLLMNVLRNGGRCGVYVLICHNPEIVYSRYESLDDRLGQLKALCAEIDHRGGGYLLQPFSLPVTVPPPLTAAEADAFVDGYAQAVEAAQGQGLSFADILPDPLFAGDSAAELSIPVGIGDEEAVVSLTLGRGSSHHALVAGATGSGKSTLLHTLIMSGMLKYSPDRLHLYLMDFKSGTEFKVYETARLPHIRLLALDAMQEFGESILENLLAEMTERGRRFKEAGQTGLEGYVRAAGRPMPRILVIMDEFQVLFNDSANRKVAMHCAEMVKRIVTEGRAFGIHLLMATQSTKVIGELTLSRGTIEQMRVRVGLKCGEDDARYLFTDRGDRRALEMMKGPIGTAVLNPEYSEEANVGFRVAYCDEVSQARLLRQIADSWAAAPADTQVFEGGRTTALLQHLAAAGAVPDAGLPLGGGLPVRIPLGELIKVAPPFELAVDRRRRQNLLVCGANERMAANLTDGYMLSALMNRDSAVYCIDGDSLVGGSASQAVYSQLARFEGRFRAAADRRDVFEFIHQVYDQFQARREAAAEGQIFVVIKNLQFLDVVKSMLKGERVDEEAYRPPPAPAAEPDPANPFAAITSYFEQRDAGGGDRPAGEKLLALIQDGSGYGIHFVVSCLEYQSVREAMYYGENVLARFPLRVIFSLSANDSDSLVEGVSAVGLPDNTVYYTDGVKDTFQLRPWLAPAADELERFIDGLTAGGGEPQ